MGKNEASASHPRGDAGTSPRVGHAGEVGGLPRRQVLAAGAMSAVGLVALAGCGSGGKNADKNSAGHSSPSDREPSSPTTQESASESASPPIGTASLVKLADIPVGSAVAAKGVDGRPLIVAQPSAGKVVAFSAICTHRGCTVAPAGKELLCPCHDSVYDAATGKNLGGPAPRPLSPVPVHVAGGEVLQGA